VLTPRLLIRVVLSTYQCVRASQPKPYTHPQTVTGTPHMQVGALRNHVPIKNIFMGYDGMSDAVLTSEPYVASNWQIGNREELACGLLVHSMQGLREPLIDGSL